MSSIKASDETRPSPVISSKPVGWRATARRLSILFKARVVSLLVLAAIGGAFLGAAGWPGMATLTVVIITGWMAASGSASLNEYLEQEQDAIMARTRGRPLVLGEVQPRWVLWVGIGLIAVPTLIVLPFNKALSFFLFAGAFIYVVIYTLWLKPRTLLNIVIGGAAGSAAVLSGGAAAGAWQEPAVLALAAMLFLWTPSHFWSLAILYRNDYAKANVPMLPVNSTPQQAAWWVFLHTGAAAFVALLMVLTPNLGLVYFIPVFLASAYMIYRNINLVKDPSKKNARILFVSSNIYLLVVLLSIYLASVLNSI
ncbi:MAG: heme o synthase [Anaerolineae bacterium]|nr:MAG: heme o synthase [Anaerolineae bacterium]